MFVYEKKLQYPVRIANPNPKLAAVFLMIRRPPRSTRKESSAASDVYKCQALAGMTIILDIFCRIFAGS